MDKENGMNTTGYSDDFPGLSEEIGKREGRSALLTMPGNR